MRTVNQPIIMGLVLAMSITAGCGSVEPTAPTDPPATSAAQMGRSVCPGAVPSVMTNLTGAPADLLEQLQATYGNDPGFLAVVLDGQKPIVIVDPSLVVEWQARVGHLGIATAPTCVDPALLAAIHAVLPAIARQLGGGVSAGYNALDDTIEVRGVDADTLAMAVEDWSPGMGARALSAISAGTLRIDSRDVPIMRTQRSGMAA